MSTYRDDLDAAQQRADKLDAELAQVRARNEQLDLQLAKDREKPAPIVQRSWVSRAMEWLDPKPRPAGTTVITLILAVLFLAAKGSHPVLAAFPLLGIGITPRMLLRYSKERRP